MDKAVLLKGYLPEDTVTLPSGQGDVRVRGLSRNEAVAMAKLVGDSGHLTPEAEAFACSHGMLDPVMTEDDVRAWRDVAVAADVQAVVERISELSNMDANAGKGPTSRSRRTRN
jgi:hypothetical protein